jgi:hypothetical protein
MTTKFAPSAKVLDRYTCQMSWTNAEEPRGQGLLSPDLFLNKDHDRCRKHLTGAK